MTKQTNKTLWTKGNCLTVRCLIKSKATCLLANFSVLCGSVTITTEIMQKRHGQTTQRTHFPYLLFTSCKFSHMRGMFSLDHIKNYMEEFVFTTKMKRRKQIYLLNVSPAPGSFIAGFLTGECGGSRKPQFKFCLILKYEFEKMGKYELVK